MGVNEGPERVIAAFWRQRSTVGGASAARFHAAHTAYDQGLLSRFCREGVRVLDLGCGTLSLGNWLVAEQEVVVHAVDGQAAFLAHAIDDARLTTEQADIRTYRPQGSFDIILLFGVIQHIVSRDDRATLYKGLSRHLAPGGAMLVKSQFGLAAAVEVDGFSAALGCDYYALYPHLPSELALLSDHFDVMVESLYPPELSPHADTAFRHLICSAKA